ncbi:MAG TPA: CBS domain-containing protein [Candidatus Saccharimonadales bacterium]|nr:CBS domain-containing protein [Candidatus Saccharimonadales bacterium]
MMVVMIILCLMVLVLLIVISGVNPQRSTMSLYELQRRKSNGDKTAGALLQREELIGDIVSLQRVASALLLVVLVTLLVATFGWLVGVILAVFVALEYGSIARLSLFQRYSGRLYEKYEPPLLSFTAKHTKGFLRLVRNITPETPLSRQLDSKEELQHLVAQSGALLSNDEKKLISHGLQFETMKVSEIMTPRGTIDSINKKELLGPLTLDDLHKTGHSRFPVIDGDVDHVIGTLHIQTLFTLDSRRSTTAEKAMEPRVFYIRQDQNLQHALAAFVRTHHHLFIVINEFRETVGVVSLEDVIEALLGRKIVDEFDTHEDLRAVAARNPRSNNHPEKREDV